MLPNNIFGTYPKKSRQGFLSALFVMLLFAPALVRAQKVVTESGTGRLRIERSMSEDAAIKEAKEMAMIDAIQNAFGSVVIQGNSTYLENKQENGKVESSSRFNTLMNTFVNGEWVETLSEKHEIIEDKAGSRWVVYTIKGKIRELPKQDISFDCYSLSCPQLSCKTEVYNEGQAFYLYFKAAQDGYLSVFADYGLDETLRILPYSESTLNNVPVKADQEYVFFYKENDYFNEGKHIINRMEMWPDKKIEDYKIFVLFGTKDFGKPILTDNTKELLSEELQKQYKMPKSLKSEAFQKWRNSIMSKNPDLQLTIIPVVVRKN